MQQPKPKKRSTATQADSLMLYNNALAKNAFYNNNPNYMRVPHGSIFGKEIDFKDPKIRAQLIKEHGDWASKYKIDKEQVSGFNADPSYIGEQRFIKKGNIYQFGDILDIFEGLSDLWFNPAAPPVMIHPDISPQGSELYFSAPFSDSSNIPHYAPLAIKPWSMLSEAEKKERLVKYGNSGSPYDSSKLQKMNPKRFPVSNSTNTNNIKGGNLPVELPAIDRPVYYDYGYQHSGFSQPKQLIGTKNSSGVYSYFTPEEVKAFNEAPKSKSGRPVVNAPQFKYGGEMNKYNNGGLIEFNGASHEQGGIQMPFGEVEGGELSDGEFVFSNIGGYSDRAKKIKAKYSKRPNDKMAQESMQREIEALKMEHENDPKILKGRAKEQKKMFRYGGPGDPPYATPVGPVANHFDNLDYMSEHKRKFDFYEGWSRSGQNFNNIDANRPVPVNDFLNGYNGYIESGLSNYNRNQINNVMFPNFESDIQNNPYEAVQRKMNNGQKIQPRGINNIPNNLQLNNVPRTVDNNGVVNNVISPQLNVESPVVQNNPIVNQSSQNIPSAQPLTNDGYYGGYSPNRRSPHAKGNQQFTTPVEGGQVIGAYPSNQLPPVDKKNFPQNSGLDFSNLAGTAAGLATKVSPLGMGLNMIGPAAQLIGTLAGGKPDPVNFERVKLPTVDYDPLLNTTARQGDIARGNMRANLRNNSQTTGQLLSNSIAGETGIFGNVADRLTNIGMQEKNQNAQIIGQQNQMNTQIGNQEQIARQQQRAAYRDAIYGSLTDLGNIGAGYLRDVNMANAQDVNNTRTLNMLNSLGLRYMMDPMMNISVNG